MSSLAAALFPTSRTLPFLLPMLVAVVAIGAGGIWLYERETARIHQAKLEELESIASLKVGQIALWRDERLMDVAFGAHGPYFVTALTEWRAGTVDATRRAGYERRLGNFLQMLRYDRAFIVGPTGTVAYAAGAGPRALAPAELAALRDASARRSAVLSQFFVLRGAGIRVSAVAPVYDAGRHIGYLVLRRDPENVIFPMLRQWPMPSTSAESVLATRDGDSILIINGMRHRPVPPMTLRLPLTARDLVGVRAFREQRPVTLEGRDYSGAEIIVRAEPVPGTPWVLGAIVDRDEVLAEARYRGVTILGFVLLGTLLSGAAFMLLYGRRQQRLDRERLEAERERRQALEDAEIRRQQLHGVVDAITDLIAAIDRDYRYVAFNRAYADEFRRAFGRSPAPGDSMLEQLAHLPDECANARAVWGRALAGEQYTIVQKFGDVEGERRTFELAFSPVRDPGGQVLGAVHTLRDVTDRIRAARAIAESEATLRRLNDDLEQLVEERTRELVEARDQAESSNRIKDVFLATMSHELRTPLNSIIGFSDILLSGIAGELNPEQRTQLGIVQKSGQQLLALISDVLDISKIEAGQLRLEPTVVPLIEVLREQERVFGLQASDRGLALRFEYPSMPVPVRADEQRLRQVIGNLLSNALKFTDHGEVGLVADFVDGRARVTVWDTGIGIPPEEQRELFTAFRRVAPKRGGHRDGTGLGLAISQRLVQAMGGEIGLESAPGQGSRFWFTLPLA